MRRRSAPWKQRKAIRNQIWGSGGSGGSGGGGERKLSQGKKRPDLVGGGKARGEELTWRAAEWRAGGGG